MRLAPFAVVCIVLFTACRAQLFEGGLNQASFRISCSASSDCPSPMKCVAEVGACIAPGSACTVERDGELLAQPRGDTCRQGDGATGICLAGTCLPSTCGDGFVDLTLQEECDDGALNDDAAPSACRTSCRRARCGDGVFDGQEECDDGNASDDDACLSSCTVNVCGDGHLDATKEECDDGNADNADTCLATCARNVCHDGFVDPAHEACDDGNTDDGDACVGACALAVCGDGFVRAGTEVCDDGNAVSKDGCRNDCAKIEVCGDGVVDANESCDDANMNANDTCNACALTSWPASVALGRGASAGIATNLVLEGPRSVAVDRSGNFVVSDFSGNRVWRIDAQTGIPLGIAGDGRLGFNGDGVPGRITSVYRPSGIAIDPFDNIYFADTANARVRRVDGATGIITTVAGVGTTCPAPATQPTCGDGGPATSAWLSSPTDVAIDHLGNLLIADSGTHTVRQVASDGIIRAFAGDITQRQSPGFAGDAGPATAARLNNPFNISVDSVGAVYINDVNNRRVRKVAGGVITTIAGNGTLSAAADGGPPTTLGSVLGIAACPSGELLLGENRKVRRIAGGVIDTLAGTGGIGSSGDGGLATLAAITPFFLACTSSGEAFVVDSTAASVRRVAQGIISTVAAGGARSMSAAGVLATSFQPLELRAVAESAAGEVHFIDRGRSAVFKIEAQTGLVRVVAGNGVSGSTGDNGPAALAQLSIPAALAFDSADNLYIADYGSHAVRKVDHTSGIITTAIGTLGSSGTSGDGGAATAAKLFFPQALAFAPNDVLYVYDAGNHRIRRVSGGTIEHVAGTGVACASAPSGVCGDGGLASVSQLGDNASQARTPGLATDATGNVYLSDTALVRVRKIDMSTNPPLMLRLAGDGTQCADTGACGDAGAASSALFGGFGGGAKLGGLAVTAMGSLIIGDARVRNIAAPITPASVISTVALTGVTAPSLPFFSGDGGDPLLARDFAPSYMSAAAAGGVYFGSGTHLRALSGGSVRSLVGVDPPGDAPSPRSEIASPVGIAIVPPFGAVISDAGSGRLRGWRTSNDTLQTLVGYPNGYPFAATTDAQSRARFSRLLTQPSGVAYDAVGQKLYFSERTANLLRVLDLVDPADPASWTIHDESDYSAGVAPAGLAFSAARRTLYVADAGQHTVRAFDPASGATQVVAGAPGTAGKYGDKQRAGDCLFNAPEALALAPDGSLYVADTGNGTVRRIAPDMAGMISSDSRVTTVLDDISAPRGLATDAFGNLFVSAQSKVWRVVAGADGIAEATDAIDVIYGRAPRTEFPMSVTHCLAGVALDQDDARILVSDACAGYVVAIRRSDLPRP